MNNLTKLDITTIDNNNVIPQIINDEYNCCEICGIELNTSVTLLCKHKFHYECIFDWYLECQKNISSGSQYVRRSCPYCRSNGGYLELPSKDNKYIKGIHKPLYIPRKKKVEQNKLIKIINDTGQCLGIAKSTGIQCKLAGKPQYGGYCGWHSKLVE